MNSVPGTPPHHRLMQQEVAPQMGSLHLGLDRFQNGWVKYIYFIIMYPVCSSLLWHKMDQDAGILMHFLLTEDIKPDKDLASETNMRGVGGSWHGNSKETWFYIPGPNRGGTLSSQTFQKYLIEAVLFCEPSIFIGLLVLLIKNAN